MRLIAHRGFAATAAENTVTALRAAADRADDETIDRVTGGVGAVADSSLAALRSHTVLDSGEPVPTLEEVLESLPPTVEIDLELKDAGIAADVLETVDGAENRIVATSFLASELRTIRELDPDQPIGLLVDRHVETPVTTAVELDCDVIGASYWRCLATGLVPRAKSVGLEVHAWTIERRPLARLLESRGVDCVSAIDRFGSDAAEARGRGRRRPD